MSGLIAPDGTPGRLLDHVRRGTIEAIVSWALLEEVVEVLGRPSLARYRVSPEDVGELLTVMTALLPEVEVVVAPRDPDDVHLVSAAVAGRAEVLVTGDKGMLGDRALRDWLMEHDVELLTPAELDRRLA